MVQQLVLATNIAMIVGIVGAIIFCSGILDRDGKLALRGGGLVALCSAVYLIIYVIAIN